MTTWFITGTDTGVGKTKIAAEFAAHLQRQGKRSTTEMGANRLRDR